MPRGANLKILVIEDTNEIIEIVNQIIELRWPEASLLSTSLGHTGVELVKKESPDIVLLDLGLPDIDGFQVLRQIRSFSDVPIIILTVIKDEINMIRGLELGADDYIVKPFSPGEFLARIKSAMRRRQPSETTGQAVTDRPFIRGTFRIDFSSREVSIGGRLIKLSPKHYDLLYQMVTHEGQVLSRQVLQEKVWGADQVDGARYVEVYMKTLKETLGKTPGHPVSIFEEDDGYKLVA